jgi:hypothetical protein
MEKIDRIIDIIRNLREDSGPTMSMGNGQIAGSVEAGDDPPVKKKKKYISGGSGSRKMWLDYFKK